MATIQLSELAHLDFEELDLLPTKEEVVKVDESLVTARRESTQWSLSPLDESPGLSGGMKFWSSNRKSFKVSSMSMFAFMW